jgi:hypothetical protein
LKRFVGLPLGAVDRASEIVLLTCRIVAAKEDLGAPDVLTSGFWVVSHDGSGRQLGSYVNQSDD